ncbi:MAG: peptide deformylase [Bacteroidales bacterium]|jgi:peptide deformylase|nr:peptide deformylase [Bacteroidales bacterium]
MILPILTYGNAVLKKKTQLITPDYPDLQTLIINMFQTMNNAKGCGLAAPQIGLPISLFVIDTAKVEEEGSHVPPVKQVFINAEILDYAGENCLYNEGCLSFPDIYENVTRKSIITIHSWDEHFIEHVDTFDGTAARVIQHEYDHTQGKIFIEYLSPLTRTLLKGKLNAIATGRKKTFYKTKSNK